MARWIALCLLGHANAVRRVGNGRTSSVFDSNGCAGPACDSLSSTEFDFVVVGSGAGGGTVAARLADNGHNVLVLEAGIDSGSKIEYQLPVLHPAAAETPDLAWSFFVDHYSNSARAGLDTKSTPKGILYPRGGTLGGSTAVNALVQLLPKTSDWERISTLTNDNSWSPSSMNKFEEALDAWLPKDPLPNSGLVADVFDPEISLGALARLVDTIKAAFDVLSIKNSTLDGQHDPVGKLKSYQQFLMHNVNDDLRKGNVEGINGFPQQIRDGHRSGARERLMQALSSGRLTIKTHALVSRVVFSNANSDGSCQGPCRAEEVMYLDGRGLYGAEINPSSSESPGSSTVRVRAGGEVILCGGAFNTPQILKQSGIGPKEELERFNIPVHVDLVGVGENLQDRYEVGIETEFYGTVPLINKDEPLPFVSTSDCNYVTDMSDKCFKHWSETGKGLYSTNGVVTPFLKRSGLTDVSDLHIFSLPGPFRGYVPGFSKEVLKASTRNKFTWAILKGHTDNRGGTIKLRCNRKVSGRCVVDPRSQPDISFHYFEEGHEYDELNDNLVDSKGERDLEAVVRAVELVRRIQNQTNKELKLSKAVESWPGENFAPGETFSNEREKIREFVKREAWGHHASCSAPMGCIPKDEVGSHNSGAGVCKTTTILNRNTVLDSRFRVRGTQGLRVVDASAFPRIPGTFLLLPTYMLGEKGAATISEDHQ